MNRAMTINFTHTLMIIVKLIVFRGGQLMYHGELHLPAVELWQAGLTTKIKNINR